MELDLMLVTASEDIDYNQMFFEKKVDTYEPYNRLVEEYQLDDWDIFVRNEGELDEENKISDRQYAIRRISKVLEDFSSNKQESPISKT